MNEIFAGTESMISIVVAACIVVFLAMIIDLGSGLMKAKQRHEIRSSWGLKRTLNKFIMYEGGMLIAAGVDLLIHFSHLLQLFHLDLIYGIPVITCLLGIFLLMVEFLSVREKADEKTKTEIARATEVASKLISTDDLAEAIAKAIELNKRKSS